MPIDWNEARSLYESSGKDEPEIAKKFGCKTETVRKKIKKENWRKKVFEQAECSTGFEAKDVIGDHRKLWKGVKRRLVRGLENSDAKLGLEELKMAKIAGEVLTNVIKGERQAWGLEDDMGEEAAIADEIAKEMDRAAVPFGADEAVDGE